MDLPQKRSNRTANLVNAVFIILLAITVSLFLISRCPHSPILKHQDNDNFKTKTSTENSKKVPDNKIITKEESNDRVKTYEAKDSSEDRVKTYEAKDSSKDKTNDTMISKNVSSDSESLKSDEDKSSSGAALSPDAQKKHVQRSILSAGQEVTILFSAESTGLTNNAVEKLEAITEFLLKNSGAEIIIEGYGDSNKTDQQNKRLSELRANIVKGYLVKHGIAGERIKTFWMGSVKPAAINDPHVDRVKTHLVEVKLRKKSADDQNN